MACKGKKKKKQQLIPARVYNTFRCGVLFNFDWLGKHHAFDLNKIYQREINEPPEY